MLLWHTGMSRDVSARQRCSGAAYISVLQIGIVVDAGVRAAGRLVGAAGVRVDTAFVAVNVNPTEVHTASTVGASMAGAGLTTLRMCGMARGRLPLLKIS